MAGAVLILLGTSLAQGAVAAQVNGVAAHGGQPLVPKLENVASDKKFFGPPFPADYPDDLSPKVGHSLKPKKREATYPRLQENGNAADHDFLHDENGDGGEWEAQMAYDNARSKYSKESQLSEAAQERMRKEAKQAEHANKEEKEADAASDAAKEKVKAADTELKEAEEELRKLEDAAKKATDGYKKHAEEIAKQNFTKEEIKTEVADSEKDLKKAQDGFKKADDGFKDCQNKYDVSKAAFEKAKTIHEALTNKMKEIFGTKIEGADAEDYTDELKAAKAEVDASKAKVKAAEAQEAAMDAKEKAFDADYERQKRQEDEAEHEAESAEKSEEQAKKELEDAKQRLRNLRNPPPPHSGALAVVPASFMALLLVAGVASLF